MDPVTEHDLKGHEQRLREILNRRLHPSQSARYQLAPIPWLSPTIFIGLQRNACTVDVTSDRSLPEICGVLSDRGARRLLCSYVEGWNFARKRYAFKKAAMTFFLEFRQGELISAKQVFRLEWDNWQTNAGLPTTAAYPHWQFDRWLTASDADRLARLRARLAAPESQAAIFESAEQQIETAQPQEPDRPDLGWFTRVHFPAIAPWATHPIPMDAKKPVSHRSVPQSLKELEDWTESALRYVFSEVETYLVFA